MSPDDATAPPRHRRRRRLRRARLRAAAGAASTTSASRCSTATTTTSSSRCSTRWRPRSWRRATSRSRCALFRDRRRTSTCKLADVASIDPGTRTVTTADGEHMAGDALVLAAGSQPNFFRTPGRGGERVPAVLARRRDAAALADPRRLRGGRSRPGADRPGRAQLRRRRRRPDRRRDRGRARRHGPRDDDRSSTTTWRSTRRRSTSSTTGTRCSGRSPTRRTTTSAKVLRAQGVRLHLGRRRHRGRARPRDARGRHGDPDALRGLGRRDQGAAARGRLGLPRGRGGRIDVEPDLTVDGVAGVYVVGDIANIPGPDGSALPQLGLGGDAERRRGRRTTCSPTSPASPASRSTTRTRASWR